MLKIVKAHHLLAETGPSTSPADGRHNVRGTSVEIQGVLNGEFLNGDVCKLVPNGPKRAQTGPNGPNWAFWAFARNAQLGILGIRPKCPIGPIWARLGPIGPIWAQMDTPKRTLNTRHPTSANCGDNLPKTGVKSPRLRVPRLAAL